jgi:hypothetical protein
MKKDVRLVVKITQDQQQTIETEAKKQDVNEAEYVRQAIEFYSAFSPEFLEAIKDLAEKKDVPITTAMQNLLLSYTATELAMYETYNGATMKTFNRSFQYSPGGELITGLALSNLVYRQSKQDAEAIKEKLEKSVRTGKPAKITTEEGVFVATHLATDEGVKPEARFAPSVTAKAAKP